MKYRDTCIVASEASHYRVPNHANPKEKVALK